MESKTNDNVSDVEVIEIPTPISITFENRCHNCKRTFISVDYSYSHCPYCGAGTVSAKQYQEFLESIIKGEDENEARD